MVTSPKHMSYLDRKIPFKEGALQIALLGIMSFSGAARYVFCVAVIIFGAVVGITRIRISLDRSSQRQAFMLVLPFILISVFGLVFDVLQNSHVLPQGARQAIMYLEPPLLAAVVLYYSKDRDQTIWLQFFASIVLFLVASLRSFNFDNPLDSLESSSAFTFGIFLLYFMRKKSYVAAVIAAVCLFLGNKRIALAAVGVGLAVYLLLRNRRHLRPLVLVVYGAFCLFVVWYIYGLFDGTVSRLFSFYNINSMGRMDIYPHFALEFNGISTFQQPCFGLGYVMTKLLEMNYSVSFRNLHNDWLAFMIDCGIFAVLAIMTCTFAVLHRCNCSIPKMRDGTALVLAMVLYWQILWLTDNVSIYVFCLYPYYSILFSLFDEQETDDLVGSGNNVGLDGATGR